MKDTLKVAGRIGAELGAAKAEVERLKSLMRQALPCQCVECKADERSAVMIDQWAQRKRGMNRENRV